MDRPISRSKFCPVKLRIVVDFLCLDVKVHLVPYKPEGGRMKPPGVTEAQLETRAPSDKA